MSVYKKIEINEKEDKDNNDSQEDNPIIILKLENNNLNNEIKRINNQITKLKSESIKTEQEKNLLLSNQTKIENNIKEIKIQLEEYNNRLIELKNKDKELDNKSPDSLSIDDNNKQIIEMQKKITDLELKLKISEHKIFSSLVEGKNYCFELNKKNNINNENELLLELNKEKIKNQNLIDEINEHKKQSEIITKEKNWEGFSTLKILKALNFYTNKTNLKNEDLYILDIGANIGWYSIYLGKYDYNIISFEPAERNFYILKKNYCLNRDINITIINKGLYTSEEECDYYENIGNKGNGMVICHQRNDISKFWKKSQKLY